MTRIPFLAAVLLAALVVSPATAKSPGKGDGPRLTLEPKAPPTRPAPRILAGNGNGGI